MSENIDFGPMMEPVARLLLGDPNSELSKPKVELRWGAHGSMSVDLTKKTWFDHSAEEGGGVLALLARDMGFSSGEAISWLKEKGFDIPDNDRSSGYQSQHSSQAPAKRTLVKTYDYRDTDGKLIFQVCRWEPKTFTQRRPVPGEEGTYINGLKAGKFMRRDNTSDYWLYNKERAEKYNNNDVKEFPEIGLKPVYRLCEVLKAISQGQQILFLEGEKDVDNSWSAGIPATTVAGGSKKWEAHYTEFFRGAHVVLCPDNDVTGRQHMALVGSKLRSIAASTVVLNISDFWKNAPEKSDLSDWQAAGNNLDGIFDLVDTHAKEWLPEPPPSKFRAVTFSQIDAVGEEHEYLVHNLLTRHELSLLYGASGSGKSFIALDIALAIARGVPYRGRRTVQGGIIYQAGEGGIGIKKRVRGYRDYYMTAGENAPPFVMLPARIDLFGKEGSTDALIAEINAWKLTFDCPLEMVVIDTLATATPGANENASTDMSEVLKNCERIRQECETAVMIVHHKNANGDRPRGHTSIFANIENALECEPTERYDSEERPDGSPITRPMRRLVVTKNKDGESGSGIDFILKQVKLGENKYGEPVTTCVCAAPAAQGDAEERNLKSLTDQQHNAMQALKSALKDHSEPVPAALKLPYSVQNVVLYRHWRLAYTALIEGEEDPNSEAVKARVKKALQRVGSAFVRSNYIGRANEFVWLTGKPVPGFHERKNEVADLPVGQAGNMDDFIDDNAEIPF